MIGDMMRYLGYVKNFEDAEGIVIIDEFDAHLHPKYQYELPKLLSTVFPKVQFIVSTHSPIPLLGVEPNTAVVLTVSRTKELGITVERLDDEIEIDRLSANSLLSSDIFGFKSIFARGSTPDTIESFNDYSDIIHFAPTSLTMLIDHPVVLGEYLKTIVLWPAASDVGEHAIDVIADSEWALQFPPARIDAYKRLVREERSVFGGVGHYRKYHWLLTLSDNLGSYGVEHHESADDRVAENTFVDDNAAKRASLLLPHEFFHSWNGKARRPAGLVNGGYEQPMRDDLLWVYEGLTNYYGELLSARAGLISPQEWIEELAADAMAVSPGGRTWRPLQDTADSAPLLYNGGAGWSGWRRSVDFYKEGSLIWLEADVTIRQLTQGRKTLDDFCALFHGENDNGRIYVKPYEADDVYAALDQVAPYTWREFFEKRLTSKSAELPLGGAANGGYRLVYTETPNLFLDPWTLDGSVNAIASLGIHVTADGTVDDAAPGTPAYRSGISNGMKIVAVNNRRFSVDELTRAIAGSTNTRQPMEFILDNGGYFSVSKVDYHGGLQYPHFERIGGTTELLTAIAQPRTK